MDFYADLHRDARAWLRVFGHQQWASLPEEVRVAYFRLMHRLPHAITRSFERSSELLPALSLTEAEGLTQLQTEVEAGTPLWPRLSTTVTRNHMNGLLNAWGVSHFRLGPPVVGQRFTGRTDHTAFALSRDFRTRSDEGSTTMQWVAVPLFTITRIRVKS